MIIIIIIIIIIGNNIEKRSKTVPHFLPSRRRCQRRQRLAVARQRGVPGDVFQYGLT
jgi:hypothetical protein